MWLFNSSPWKNPIFKFGRPSISMGHLYHDYVSHNQRVYKYIYIYKYGNDASKYVGRARPRGPGGSMKYQFVYLNVVTCI